jgi:hypothetical protein
MTRDIDQIIVRLRATHPGIQVEQLKVKFPGADDDGLWYFRHPAGRGEVQIESSAGTVPFIVESNQTSARATGNTVEETVSLVASLLGLGDGTA